MQVIVPPPDRRSYVSRVIYDELCRGAVRDDSRAGYPEVIAGLIATGA